MTKSPSVLIVSCSKTRPKSLIKLITKQKNVAEEENDLVIHPWLIDTKYYTANVNLIGLNDHTRRNEELDSTIEGLIIHMDSNKEDGLAELKIWEDVEKNCDLEVKLLLANYCTDDTKIKRKAAVEWCVKNGYEFIELYPSIIDHDEKVGVDRVVEALQAHTWSNLEMKTVSKSRKENSNSKKEDGESSGQDTESEEALDDFTELFSQLHMMRDSLNSLPMKQRKQCAEQMVTAFWKAIGGEEEEIADLD